MVLANPRINHISDIKKNRNLLTHCEYILDDIRQEIIKRIQLFSKDYGNIYHVFGEEDEEDIDYKKKKIDQLSASLMTAVGNKLYDSVKKIQRYIGSKNEVKVLTWVQR